MKLEQRIKKLEDNIAETYVDPREERELKEWVKEHPGYRIFTQRENNNAVLPEHFDQTIQRIISRTFAERNLIPTCSNLLAILPVISELFKGYENS